MDTKKSLSIGMGILFLFTIIFYGTIIVNFKSADIMLPKVEKKLNNYINTKHKNISKELVSKKAKYDISDNCYYMKVLNKNNKHLFFTIKYKNKNITDTYKKDYLEGNSLLTWYEKKLKRSLKTNKNFDNTNIKFNKKLNNYTNLVKNNLINDIDIKSLSVYSLSADTTVKEINMENVIKSIRELYKYTVSSNLNPSYYSITITDESDISKSIKISKLNNELINNGINEIVSGIINNDRSIIKKYGITYKYLN